MHTPPPAHPRPNVTAGLTDAEARQPSVRVEAIDPSGIPPGADR